MATAGTLETSRMVDVITRYSAAYVARDVPAMLEFFAEDADITVGPGIFHGKEAMKEFLTWDAGVSPSVKIRPFGAGLVASGNIVVSERVVETTFDGNPFEYPVVTIYELDDDARIKHMRSYYDKLAIEQKVASRIPGVKGWFTKRMLDYLVAQGEKGLRHS